MFLHMQGVSTVPPQLTFARHIPAHIPASNLSLGFFFNSFSGWTFSHLVRAQREYVFKRSDQSFLFMGFWNIYCVFHFGKKNLLSLFPHCNYTEDTHGCTPVPRWWVWGHLAEKLERKMFCLLTTASLEPVNIMWPSPINCPVLAQHPGTHSEYEQLQMGKEKVPSGCIILNIHIYY